MSPEASARSAGGGVTLPSGGCPIDHLLWAVPDLASGIDMFEAATGVRAELGGEHPELGTHNALASLGDRCYLEIIAARPEPKRNHIPLWNLLRNQSTPKLLTFAVAAPNLGALMRAASSLGYKVQGPTPGSRKTPTGRFVRWETLLLTDHPFALAMPFFIDWLDSPHPALSAPRCGRLDGLTVVSPQSAELTHSMNRLGVDVAVRQGPAAGFVAEIETAKGRILLTG